MRGRARSKRPGRAALRPAPPRMPEHGEVSAVIDEILNHPEGGPRLSAGDLDADWRAAESVGDETVGGSAVTPDQDIVDEIGRALGVEQESDAEVRMSAEILEERDRLRWRLEHEAARQDAEREREPDEEE